MVSQQRFNLVILFDIIKLFLFLLQVKFEKMSFKFYRYVIEIIKKIKKWFDINIM